MVGIVCETCCNILCVSLPVISYVTRICDLKSICLLTCGISDMLHISLLSYSKFLSNSSTPEKGETFVRNATKTYELAPTINKAESFCQMMKNMLGSVAVDICQYVCPH